MNCHWYYIFAYLFGWLAHSVSSFPSFFPPPGYNQPYRKLKATCLFPFLSKPRSRACNNIIYMMQCCCQIILEICRCFGDLLALIFFPKVNFYKTTPSRPKCCIHCHCPENPKYHQTIFISAAVYSPAQWWKSCILLQGHDCPNLNTSAHSKGWCRGVWGLTVGSGCQAWPCAHCGWGRQGPHTCHMYP